MGSHIPMGCRHCQVRPAIGGVRFRQVAEDRRANHDAITLDEGQSDAKTISDFARRSRTLRPAGSSINQARTALGSA